MAEARWQIPLMTPLRSGAGEDLPSLESMLQKVEEGLLHHVGDFITLQGWTNQNYGSHRWNNFIGWNVVNLKWDNAELMGC